MTAVAEVVDMVAVVAARERLLRATMAVRAAIDEECDPLTGTILSSDPEFERKCRRFDALQAEEKAAWEELKRVRGGVPG